MLSVGACAAAVVLTGGRVAWVRFAVVFGVAAACLAALLGSWAEVVALAGRTSPVVMVVGYSAVAAVVTLSGVLDSVGRRSGPFPIAVFGAAAALTVVTSNDVVIVALAPIVLLAERPWRAAAALFIGANVTAVFLPQGSPTNVIVQSAADLSFVDYARITLLIGVVMAVVAGLGVWALLGRNRDGHHLDEMAVPLGRRGWAVLAVAAATIVTQPLADLFGLPQWAVGVVVGCVALAWGASLGIRPVDVLTRTAWVVVPVAMVAIAVGGVLADYMALGPPLGALGLFITSGVLTDITGAAVGAELVTNGVIEAQPALVAVTAGAFLTPIGSVSGLLLITKFREAGVPIKPIVFVVPALVAVACWVVAMGVTG